MEKNLRQLKSSCLKIVLFGPESSGKTTLSKELANHYKTLWVKEYARDYLQKKWNVEKKVCELEDLIPIAIGQIKLENELSKISKQLLICDTDLLETKVYSETYYDGYCDPLLEKYALKNSYDLYILTNIDIPWEKDDLRDKPNEREKMFDAFKETLIKYNRPYIEVSGSLSKRLVTATKSINTLINK
jgi:NadR type nicotinamide-nucleotide adenylyltransferase